MSRLNVKKLFPWFIWGLAALFFFSEYFARVAPSVMVEPLMRSFNTDAFHLGSLSAFFYYAYVVMQIPVGTLMDRFGPHKLLTLMAGVSGVACLTFAHSHSLGGAEASRFLLGFSAAFAFVGALKLASVWFPSSKFGFLSGLTQALGMFGAAAAEGPVSVLVSHIGWRETMIFIGGFLIVLGFLIGVFVRDEPNSEEKHEQALAKKQYTILSGLWRVLKTPATWINAVFVGFLYAPTAAFGELWGASYLHRVYSIHTDVAASAVGMIFLGFGVGSPIAGWISDKIQRRKPVVLTSILGSLILMSIILYVPGIPVALIFVLMFLYGFFNVGVATSYAIACEITPLEIGGTSMSFANMASVIIGALFQPIIGWLLDLRWDHLVVHGVRYYAAGDFRFAMLTLPLCFIISLIAAAFLKESYRKA